MRLLLDTNVVEHARRHQLGTENACFAAWSAPAHARLYRDLVALDRLLRLAVRYGNPEFRVAPESLREQEPAADVGRTRRRRRARSSRLGITPGDDGSRSAGATISTSTPR